MRNVNIKPVGASMWNLYFSASLQHCCPQGSEEFVRLRYFNLEITLEEIYGFLIFQGRYPAGIKN